MFRLIRDGVCSLSALMTSATLTSAWPTIIYHNTCWYSSQSSFWTYFQSLLSLNLSWVDLWCPGLQQPLVYDIWCWAASDGNSIQHNIPIRYILSSNSDLVSQHSKTMLFPVMSNASHEFIEPFYKLEVDVRPNEWNWLESSGKPVAVCMIAMISSFISWNSRDETLYSYYLHHAWIIYN